MPWPGTSRSRFRSAFADAAFRALAWAHLASWRADPLSSGVFLSCTRGLSFSHFSSSPPLPRAGLMAFLVSHMFPGTLMLIPRYTSSFSSGWARLSPAWFALHGDGHSLLRLMMNLYSTIPKELEESALIDGASMDDLSPIVLPAPAKPALR